MFDLGHNRIKQSPKYIEGENISTDIFNNIKRIFIDYELFYILR